jgi:DNA-binding transcriptional LysR family regulator
MKPPRATLDQWRAFQAVMESGGFARAAGELHRTQSSVSYTVRRLQENLGVTLLRTEGRRARLTEAGEVMLRRSRQLLEDAAALESLADSLQQGWEPHLQLVVDAAFPADVLIAALRRFEPLSRGTRVRLQQVVLSGADEALAQGDADVVIGYRVPPGFLGDPLIDIEFTAVAHPGHALHRRGRQLSMKDLERELQVVIRDSGATTPTDHGWLGAEHRWTVTSMDTALTIVSGGLGFAWLPTHMISPYLDDDRLRVLPLREGRRRRSHLYLMFPRPDDAGPAARQLAESLREACHT